MLTRFDHAVIGVRSLEGAVDRWRSSLAFDPRPGGRHTGRGTHNAIVRFGLDYIELISIEDRALVDRHGDDNALALAALLDRAEGGMLGFALATDDIEAEGLRMRASGIALHGPAAMERMRPDGRLLRWRLLVPQGGSWGTPLPFFIQWDTRDAERLSWEQPGMHENAARRIQALAIAVEDLEQWRNVYQQQLGLQPLGQDRVPELGATRATFRCGDTDLQLLAPDGPGVINSAVEAGHLGPWQITLAVSSIEKAEREIADRGLQTLPAPGTPAGLLIPPELALSARIVLQPT